MDRRRRVAAALMAVIVLVVGVDTVAWTGLSVAPASASADYDSYWTLRIENNTGFTGFTVEVTPVGTSHCVGHQDGSRSPSPRSATSQR